MGVVYETQFEALFHRRLLERLEAVLREPELNPHERVQIALSILDAMHRLYPPRKDRR